MLAVFVAFLNSALLPNLLPNLSVLTHPNIILSHLLNLSLSLWFYLSTSLSLDIVSNHLPILSPKLKDNLTPTRTQPITHPLIQLQLKLEVEHVVE